MVLSKMPLFEMQLETKDKFHGVRFRLFPIVDLVIKIVSPREWLLKRTPAATLLTTKQG